MLVRKNSHSKNGITRPLARVGDPYVMLNGKVIKPDQMVEDMDEAVEVPSVKEFKAVKKRTAKELPAPVNVMNGVAVVFCYTILGLGDREIAEACKISVEHVQEIRGHSAYQEYFEAVVHEVINANSDNINSRIAHYSHHALTNIVDLAMNGKAEELRGRMNQDILNRAGITAKDQDVRGSMNKSDLRIIVIKASENVDVAVEPLSLDE